MMNGLNYLWYGKMLPVIIAASPYTDPMRLIWSDDTDAKMEQTSRYYGVLELFNILQTGFTIICICAVLVSLIAMLFVNKAEMIADKKANIIHKLGIVFLISSFASILNIVYNFVRGVFFTL